MGKFRCKLKGQTKGKRWPKGQSSNSNPETRKFRDQAKSRFFQENLGPSSLTSDAIQKHNAFQTLAVPSQTPTSMDTEEESQSIYTSEASYKTMQSFASEWSECSNMSFNRFLKVFRSDSALHKEMLAILAAITEVIKINGGAETPTEYYCSLVTTLEQIMASEEKNEDQVTATISLLNMGIKTVPVSVLRSSFDNVSGKILTVLAEYSKSENNVIVRSALGVLGVLLKNQEIAMWNHSQMQQIFSSILNPFCIHTKPKWRKSAQSAALLVIKADIFKNDKNYNPAADRVAEFCQQTLDACLGANSNSTVLVSSIQAGQTTILHTLGLLKDTIQYFNKNHLKSICETILRLMSLNYPIVTSCSLQVLYSLFSSQTVVASARLNGQIIAALYDYQPSSQDVQPTSAWLAVMQQAHIHLADADIEMSSAALPKILSAISQLWLTQKGKIFTAATRAIEMLLKDALAPMCASPELVQKYQTKISSCVHTLEACLGYQYHHAWHQILHSISVLFEVSGAHCQKMLTGLLKVLSELRDSYKFTYNNELEFAVGAAIKSMGAESVLSVIPLQKDNGDFNLDRSWLILVLKENVQNSTLEFWVKNILPFSLYCQKRSVHLASVNDGIGSHSAELLHFQLWNLLPSFCNNPTDILTSFKSVARTLGMAISDNKDLRITAMAAIRKLIQSSKDNNNEADIAELSRFDKNFLPILFNLYTTKAVGTDEEGQRLASLETIKVYLTIAKPELTKQLFESALERLTNANDLEENFTKESILDLLRTLLAYQDKESIDKLYNMCIKKLPEIKNRTEQKKTYRLLEEVCRSETEGCTIFLKANRKYVQKLLRKSLNSAAVSSKGARLRCLSYLIKAQPQLDHDSLLIKSAIPEAILCCRDLNTRCRETAFGLINTIGEILEKHNEMKEFLTMVVAGLAGNPQMISMTIIALSSILHNFTGSLGQDNVKVILENVLQLLVTPTREITSSCLGFIKIFVSSLPRPTVASFLPMIVKSLSSMTDDCKRHFRVKVRNLLDKLMRKFGCESITPLIPSSDTVMYKQIRNLRKLHSRMKRNKDENDKDEGDESDADDDFLVKTRPKTMEEILADSDSDFEEEVVKEKPKKGKKQFSTFIDEDPDTIVDFNDPSAASRIMASKPMTQTENVQDKPKKQENRGFKTAPDGRLIIAVDSSDSDDDDKSKKGKKFDIGLDSDSGDDAETDVLRDRKRKRSDASSIASTSISSKMYKPGGSGIHRKVAASSSSVKSFGSEYKSKKATGDVKKKGKHDPYAYVPLQRSTLNKRKKNKLAGQFKNMVGAAKSGARKGMKAKRGRKL